MLTGKQIILVAAIVFGCAVAVGGTPGVQARDACVNTQGQTRVQSGASTCTADTTSVAVAVNGSTATAGAGTTTIAVNGSTAAGNYDLRVIAVNGSTARANTEAVRDDCSLVAINGETLTCP